ncbi:hypothetical protein LCGC14_1118880 [marine sediment metagenome]|uniref:Uncharacterized protein n=1 Tax=marine sediment metagenome TaxID=412755 RepID=A0A0F9QAG6_9ZZZZ
MINKNNIKYYFLGGIMIALGISFSVAAIIHLLLLNANSLYVLGIFFGGLFIGIGLLPFPTKEIK